MGNVKGSLTGLASTASANKTNTSSSKDSDTTNGISNAFLAAMTAIKNKKNAPTTGGVEGSPYVGDDPSKKQAGRRRGTNTQGSGRGLNVT